jgi:hypothetical protein
VGHGSNLGFYLGALGAGFAEPAGYDDGRADAAFSTGRHHAWRRRYGHDQHRKFHRVRYIQDGGVAGVSQDLTAPGIDRVDAALITAIAKVPNHAKTELVLISGRADYGHATGREEVIQPLLTGGKRVA